MEKVKTDFKKGSGLTKNVSEVKQNLKSDFKKGVTDLKLLFLSQLQEDFPAGRMCSEFFKEGILKSDTKFKEGRRQGGGEGWRGGGGWGGYQK
jgi:hypothetical protein